MENQNITDLLESLSVVEGRDNDGSPKATVVLQNHIYAQSAATGKTEATICDSAATLYAEVRFAYANGFLYIELVFDSFDDPDYLRFKDLCKNLRLSKNRNNGKGEDSLAHQLVLYFTDKTHEFWNICFMIMYSFDGDAPIIRFTSTVDSSFRFELSDDMNMQLLESHKDEESQDFVVHDPDEIEDEEEYYSL